VDYPHRCTIQRDINGRDGPPERDGHRARVADWQPQHVDVPCRLVSKQQRVVDLATGAGTIVTTYLLLLPARYQLRPTLERVVNVTTRTGERVEPGPFSVISSLARTGAAGSRAHASVGLELQGGRHAA
jgi:hypothetical protein